jgi:hypothetical protein
MFLVVVALVFMAGYAAWKSPHWVPAEGLVLMTGSALLLTPEVFMQMTRYQFLRKRAEWFAGKRTKVLRGLTIAALLLGASPLAASLLLHDALRSFWVALALAFFFFVSAVLAVLYMVLNALESLADPDTSQVLTAWVTKGASQRLPVAVLMFVTGTLLQYVDLFRA